MAHDGVSNVLWSLAVPGSSVGASVEDGGLHLAMTPGTYTVTTNGFDYPRAVGIRFVVYESDGTTEVSDSGTLGAGDPPDSTPLSWTFTIGAGELLAFEAGVAGDEAPQLSGYSWEICVAEAPPSGIFSISPLASFDDVNLWGITTAIAWDDATESGADLSYVYFDPGTSLFRIQVPTATEFHPTGTATHSALLTFTPGTADIDAMQITLRFLTSGSVPIAEFINTNGSTPDEVYVDMPYSVTVPAGGYISVQVVNLESPTFNRAADGGGGLNLPWTAV